MPTNRAPGSENCDSGAVLRVLRATFGPILPSLVTGE